MAFFPCKMCGGSVEYEPGDDVAVCASCGTPQPVPDTGKEADGKIKKTVALIVLIAAALLMFFVVRTKVIVPNGNYKKAVALYNAGEYDEAIEAFEALDDYKDSNSRIIDCQSKIRGALLKEQNAGLKAAAVGSTVRFGFYEQDNNPLNGQEEIEWQVLAVRENQALLVSKHGLDSKPYNTISSNVTWATCSLRRWLNNDFLDAAFDAEQQAKIETAIITETTAEIVTEDAAEDVTEETAAEATEGEEPDENASPVNYPNDQIFLLSLSEVEEYFTSDEARKCAPTDYAIEQGAWASDGSVVGGKATGWWWLRSPGVNAYSAAVVVSDGSVLTNGINVYRGSDCVRPAIWVNLDE